MSFVLNKLIEVGVVLEPVSVVIDHLPSFPGVRELLTKEFERLAGWQGETVYLNSLRRGDHELMAWFSAERETAEIRRAVVNLNHSNFQGTIIDVSLVVNGLIVRCFGTPDRARPSEVRISASPLLDWTNIRVPARDRTVGTDTPYHRGISKSAIKKELLQSVLPHGKQLTSTQARGYFMSLASAGKCYRCQKPGHKP